MDRKKQEAIDRLNVRWANMFRLMQSLIGEFKMFKACHQHLLKEYYEDDSQSADTTSQGEKK